MIELTIQVEGELTDLLDERPVDGLLRLTVELPAGLRDVVQSLGIPHVECRAVVVNGTTSTWQYTVGDGDHLVVHPRYPLGAPPADPRFLLDDHLGKLARDLRMLGIDAEHEKAVDDAALVQRSLAEHRIVLSRDIGLLMRGLLDQGRYVRSTDPAAQAAEVVRSFALVPVVAPLTRCLACNGVLEEAPLEQIADQVPASAAARNDRFRRCSRCQRAYWEGTHVDALKRRVRSILERSGAELNGCGRRGDSTAP